MERDGNERQVVTRPYIGEWLVRRVVVSQDDVERSLIEARTSGERLASFLLSRGLASEEAIVEALATYLGVPGVDFSHTVLGLDVLRVIPQEVAAQEHILPVQISGNKLVLAMADPQNARIVQEVELISGLSVLPHVALSSRLEQVAASGYAMAARGELFWVGEQLLSNPRVASIAILAPAAPESLPLGELADFEIEHESGEFEIDVAAASSARISSNEEVIGSVMARAAPPNVLVVDDDEDILNLVTKALQKSGYVVRQARRGNEAVTEANAALPDLILLDAHLPELHGFDVCRKLKANPRFARVPIVMMTAVYRGWRFAQDSREAFGADDYIEKPFRIADLLGRVEHHLAHAAGDPKGNKEQAEALYLEGLRTLEGGRHADAAKLLEKAADIDAFNPKVFFALGKALQGAGEGYRAISALERSVELRPDHFPALRSLAALYQQKGFRRKALEAWERAIPAAPDEETRQKIKNSLMLLL